MCIIAAGPWVKGTRVKAGDMTTNQGITGERERERERGEREGGREGGKGREGGGVG